MKKCLLSLGFLSLVAALSHCAEPRLDEADALHVCAASSLRDILPPIIREWEEHHDTPISVTLDASNRLARQMEMGAPCTLFLSANPRWVARLAENKHLVPHVEFTRLTNALTVVHHPEYAESLNTMEDLQKLETLALGAPHVPVGEYALEALNRHSDDPLHAQILTGRNTEQVLNLVALGHAQAGIVYRSDTLSTQDTRVAFLIPSSLYSPIQYQAGVVPNAGKNTHKFLSLLMDPRWKKLYEDHGFHLSVQEARVP